LPDLVDVVSGTMESIGHHSAPGSLDEAEEADRAARQAAGDLVRRRGAAVAAR